MKKRFWNPATQRIVFVAIVTLGLVLGLVLGVREASQKPVLKIGEPRVRVEGTTATVQITVKNTSEKTVYCPSVGIAAIDRDGLDLAKSVALPDLTDGRLEPRASANFIGTLTDLSQQDIDEKLDEYVAFIIDKNPCE
ncbi:MAG: hypothetical protein K8R99_09815 [Actinomycetia bacterium]|nr:hypothetical protein [Actinomycetes bacterium]